ncbi:MAG: transglycosylase SLT domain-containing protein [Pseudomonadota bacterium]
MTAAINGFGSEFINKYQQLAGKDVFQAIETASTKTGVDFSYLLEQAQAESNFKPEVKAKTSSATGLFQFIDNTWLEMVAKHGYKHGLGQYGQEISYTPGSGKIKVSSPEMKQEILELRKDPDIASKMAAEFAKDNQEYLERKTKREVGSTEMYLAHFLGAGQASKFINAQDGNGDQAAAKLFPRAAKANQNVFFNQNGTSRSLEQVYAFFDKKFSDSPAPAPTQAPGPDTDLPVYATDNTRHMAENNAIRAQEAVQNMRAEDMLPAEKQPPRSQNIQQAQNHYGAIATTAPHLFQNMSQIDVMMMSDMIRQWSNEDASRAYQSSNFSFLS